MSLSCPQVTFSFGGQIEGSPCKGKVLGRRLLNGCKGKVLSVDDDPVNQMVVESLLAPEGYEVIRAMDGFEALEFCTEQGMPDLILLDISECLC